MIRSESSYIGCEYWPVFLQNYSGYSYVYMDLTVVVSNPNNETAKIYVFDKSKYENTSHQPYLSFDVPPGGVVTKLIVGDSKGNVSDNTAVSNSGQTIYDYMLKNTMIAPYAFKLRSSLPVVVYQFNPFGKANGCTADASLMLPVNTLGKDYFHIGFYGSSSSDAGGNVSVVATENGETNVWVTTKLSTVSGSDLTNSTSIAAMSANERRKYTLKQFDVLNLQQGSSGETTGLYINSDKKIGVFSGHACLNINSYCDHVEEMMFPTSSQSELSMAHFRSRSAA